MHRNLPHRNSVTPAATMRRWVIVCLLIALPLCNAASAVAVLMGARHFHASAAVQRVEAGAVESVAQAAFKPARRTLFVHAGAASAEHAHDDLQRHHHEATERSAVFVDVSASTDAARAELDASSSKAAASLLTLLCLTDASWPDIGKAPPAPRCEVPRWSLQTAELRALRRPPKA